MPRTRRPSPLEPSCTMSATVTGKSLARLYARPPAVSHRAARTAPSATAEAWTSDMVERPCAKSGNKPVRITRAEPRHELAVAPAVDHRRTNRGGPELAASRAHPSPDAPTRASIARSTRLVERRERRVLVRWRVAIPGAAAVHRHAAECARARAFAAAAASITARVPSMFARRNRSQPPPARDERGAVKDRCRSPPGRAQRRAHPGCRRARARRRPSRSHEAAAASRTSARTVQPSASSRSTMCEPTSPVAPVTSARLTPRGNGSGTTCPGVVAALAPRPRACFPSRLRAAP